MLSEREALIGSDDAVTDTCRSLSQQRTSKRGAALSRPFNLCGSVSIETAKQKDTSSEAGPRFSTKVAHWCMKCRIPLWDQWIRTRDSAGRVSIEGLLLLNVHLGRSHWLIVGPAHNPCKSGSSFSPWNWFCLARNQFFCIKRCWLRPTSSSSVHRLRGDVRDF